MRGRISAPNESLVVVLVGTADRLEAAGIEGDVGEFAGALEVLLSGEDALGADLPSPIGGLGFRQAENGGAAVAVGDAEQSDGVTLIELVGGDSLLLLIPASSERK